MEKIGHISQIETMGVFDGPGIRFVVFFQGCSLRCKYCHNPETWKIGKGKISITAQELMEKILKYKSYFGEDGGVTFSGGEPLLQSEFLLEVLTLCKQNNIHTCLDTSGQYFDNIESIIEKVDLIILDIKSTNEKEYTFLTSGKIKKQQTFLNLCQKKNKKLWLRTVIIPNINDTDEHIENLATFIKPLKNVEKVELLPFGQMGKSKYEEMKIEYPFKDIQSMNIEKCKILENKLMDLIKKK